MLDITGVHIGNVSCSRSRILCVDCLFEVWIVVDAVSTPDYAVISYMQCIMSEMKYDLQIWPESLKLKDWLYT